MIVCIWFSLLHVWFYSIHCVLIVRIKMFIWRKTKTQLFHWIKNIGPKMFDWMKLPSLQLLQMIWMPSHRQNFVKSVQHLQRSKLKSLKLNSINQIIWHVYGAMKSLLHLILPNDKYANFTIFCLFSEIRWTMNVIFFCIFLGKSVVPEPSYEK